MAWWKGYDWGWGHDDWSSWDDWDDWLGPWAYVCKGKGKGKGKGQPWQPAPNPVMALPAPNPVTAQPAPNPVTAQTAEPNIAPVPEPTAGSSSAAAAEEPNVVPETSASASAAAAEPDPWAGMLGGVASAAAAAPAQTTPPWDEDESWAMMNLKHTQLCKHYQNFHCLKGAQCGFAHSLKELKAAPTGWPLAATDFPAPQSTSVTERFAAYYEWELELGYAPKWATQVMAICRDKPRMPEAQPLRAPSGFKGPRGFWPKGAPQIPPVAPKEPAAPPDLPKSALWLRAPSPPPPLTEVTSSIWLQQSPPPPPPPPPVPARKAQPPLPAPQAQLPLPARKGQQVPPPLPPAPSPMPKAQPPPLPKQSASAAAPPPAHPCPCRDARLTSATAAMPPGFVATRYVPQTAAEIERQQQAAALQLQIEVELAEMALQRQMEEERAMQPPLAEVPVPNMEAQPSVLDQPIDEAASTSFPAGEPNVEEAREPSELGQPSEEAASTSGSTLGSAGPPSVQAESVPCLFPTQGRSAASSARHRSKSRNKMP